MVRCGAVRCSQAGWLKKNRRRDDATKGNWAGRASLAGRAELWLFCKRAAETQVICFGGWLFGVFAIKQYYGTR